MGDVSLFHWNIWIHTDIEDWFIISFYLVLMHLLNDIVWHQRQGPAKDNNRVYNNLGPVLVICCFLTFDLCMHHSNHDNRTIFCVVCNVKSFFSSLIACYSYSLPLLCHLLWHHCDYTKILLVASIACHISSIVWEI